MSMMIDNTKARPTRPIRIGLLLATAMRKPAMPMVMMKDNARLVIVLCLPSSKDDILCCLEYLR